MLSVRSSSSVLVSISRLSRCPAPWPRSLPKKAEPEETSSKS